MNNQEKIEFVINALKNGEFEILPESLTTGDGPVYKVKLSGDLATDGLERGFLYIPKGSGVKAHSHIKDLEIYRLLQGFLSVNGEPTEINICGLGNNHGIDEVPVDTIIETCKMNEIFLGEDLASYQARFQYLKAR